MARSALPGPARAEPVAPLAAGSAETGGDGFILALSPDECQEERLRLAKTVQVPLSEYPVGVFDVKVAS